jgi:prevent-host-death family protein
MKTATVRDLRNHYLTLMKWIAAGEEIVITKRGRPIARLIPESRSAPTMVDWSQSPAVARDRSLEACLNAEEAGDILRNSSGQW